MREWKNSCNRLTVCRNKDRRGARIVKKGEIYEGTIGKFDFPDKGVIELPEGKITIKHALPGQKVRVMINKKRGGRCEGRILEVLEHSSLESAENPCPHFGSCGGCVYQTIPYAEQLKIKEQQVKDLIDGVCEDYEFEGIRPSPVEAEYRNKMEFSFGDEYKDGPLALGMHKRGSFYDVVTTTECNIVNPDFCDILKTVKEYFEQLGTGFYKKMQHTGYLRHLLVRRAVKTGEILVALVTTTQEEVDLKPLTDLLLGLSLNGKIVGILHILNDSLADVVKSDRTDILYGQDYFYEELLGLKFKISPFSFFQTNSLGAEVLYETVRGYVGETKDKVVFDLYSGTGTIAQDVLKIIDELKDKPDLIILDPPRDGIHPKALGKIIDFGVDRMVYVSCKPTSLVRDLVVLQERGYRVEKVCCVDMFPSTANVETVVLLQREEN